LIPSVIKFGLIKPVVVGIYTDLKINFIKYKNKYNVTKKLFFIFASLIVENELIFV